MAFITNPSASLSGYIEAIVSGTGQFISTAQTGQFAPSGMTGQFVTTAQTGHAHSQYLTSSQAVTGISVTGFPFVGQVVLTGVGSVVVTTGGPNTIWISGVTGNLVFQGVTGQFAPIAQTGHIHSQYALVAGTGQFVSTAQTGQFAPSGMTGQFVTTAQTGHIHTQYALVAGTGQFISTAQTGNFVPVGITGSAFYPRYGNPGNFLTAASLGGVNTINVTGQLLSGDIIITGIGGTIVDISGGVIRISGGAGGPGGNYVTTDTEQQVTAKKFFTEDVYITGAAELHISNTGRLYGIRASGWSTGLYEIASINYQTGQDASADIRAGLGENPWDSFTNLGINASGYTGAFVGSSGDGYCFHEGNDFYVGNVTSGRKMIFFAGHEIKGTPAAQLADADMILSSGRLDVSGIGNFTDTVFVSGQPVVIGNVLKVKAAAFTNPDGIFSGTYQTAVYRCTDSSLLTGIRAWRYGGSGCFVNAYKNSPSLPHLSANMLVNVTGAWVSSGSPLTNNSYAVGDTLILAITSISGLPTSVTIQADFLS